MTLSPLADVSVADWFVSAHADWWTLATQGPPGFESYATVWFDGDVEDETAYRTDEQVFALVATVAAAHTSTPTEAYFGLWDGWGDIDEGRLLVAHPSPWAQFGRIFRPARPDVIAPAFPDTVVNGPKVELRGDRAYHFFHGPVTSASEWGAAPLAPGWPRSIAPPSIAWPADRAWFIAADVDPCWLCIGGSASLISELLAHPGLDAEPAEHGVQPPLELEDR